MSIRYGWILHNMLKLLFQGNSLKHKTEVPISLRYYIRILQHHWRTMILPIFASGSEERIFFFLKERILLSLSKEQWHKPSVCGRTSTNQNTCTTLSTNKTHFQKMVILPQHTISLLTCQQTCTSVSPAWPCTSVFAGVGVKNRQKGSE